jgi:serine/threonine-protein kinase
MSSEAPVSVGDVVAGKYKILRVLGSGGMGVVVQAEHLELGQSVALKFLRPGTVDTAAAERFVREARAAVRIRSEHVARVIDVGRIDESTPFMVMEYLDGRDLGQLIASDAPVAIPRAVGCVLEACEAIAEAHALGIVHRDLKPSNIFVSSRADGTPIVKVLDFGISKAIDGDEPVDVALTNTGVILGSPLYMSPEQLRNMRAVDTRTDIWSLGIILHELLTSRHAFEADSMPTLCAMIAADPPRPLRSLRPDAPEELEEVITRCLQKEPADRYRTVADFARALLPFAGPEGSTSVDRIVRVIVGSADTAISLSHPPARSQTTRASARRRKIAIASLVAIASLGIVLGAIGLFGPAARGPRTDPSALLVTSPATREREDREREGNARDLTPVSSAVTLSAVQPAATSSSSASSASPVAAPAASSGSAHPSLRARPRASSAAASSSSNVRASHPRSGEPLDPLVDQR